MCIYIYMFIYTYTYDQEKKPVILKENRRRFRGKNEKQYIIYVYYNLKKGKNNLKSNKYKEFKN